MKKYRNISILLLSLIAVFSSCDKIPEDEYLKEKGPVEWAGKYVILEDYTGHECVYCPEAAVEAANLKKIYGKNLIVMAVHAPTNSLTQPTRYYPEDFTTTTGDAWANRFGIANQLPVGMVNRRSFISSGKVLGRGDWSKYVAEQMLVTPLLNLDLTVDYNESSREVSLKATATFLQAINQNLRIGAFLLQDSIKGVQLTKDAAGKTYTDTSYYFNHTFRTAFEGTWGKIFVNANDGFRANDTKEYTLKFSIDAIDAKNVPIVPENCHIVVYVATDEPANIGDALYEILQAAEKPLIQHAK